MQNFTENRERRHMRIAQVIGKMKKGGVEAVVFNYLRNISDESLSFDVLYDADSTATPPEDLVKKGVRFIEIPPYQKLPSYICAVKKLCEENRYDAVHVHMNTLSVFALYAARLANVKHRICHNHSTTSKKEKKRNLLKLILRPLAPVFATEYASCGELAGRWMYGDKRFDAGKVTVLNNAIETDRYAYSPDARAEIRKEYGIDRDAFVVGHVGRFVNVKNHLFLVELFKEYAKSDCSARLILVGGGEKLEEIKEKVAGEGIADKVIFTNEIPNTAPFYSAMDVFCLPSLYEGLPVVALEAQASGLPCLISDKATRECKVGSDVVFLPIDKGARLWAEALATVSVGDRTKAVGLFKNGKFDIEISAAELVSFYKRLGSQSAV